MWIRLLALCGVMLIVAACETTSDESADSMSDGTPPPPAAMDDGDSMAAAAPAMTLQDILAQEVGDRVFFDYDAHGVRSDGEATLRRQAAFLNENPGSRIVIAGHCDERGTREYNLALGERRATAAKNYLVSLGIPVSRITTISYGKERPVVPGGSDTAWAQNRVAITAIQ